MSSLHLLYDVRKPFRIARLNLRDFDPMRTDYTVEQLDDWATLFLIEEKRLSGNKFAPQDGPQWINNDGLRARARREIHIGDTGMPPEDINEYNRAEYMKTALRDQ